MTDYTVTIKETSRELTKRERIMLKDTSDAVSLDQATQEANGVEGVVITPEAYAILGIHNEMAKGDKDYDQILIMDTIGNKWITGSQTFITSFIDIFNEMEGEEFSFKVVRKPSKNYSGKEFLKAVLI